jgi:cytochrome c oxidase subunit 2
VSRFLPIAASEHAGQIDWTMTLVHWLMAGLFVGWSIYLAWVLFRYRRGRQPMANHAGCRGTYATATEIGIVVAESVLLVGLALPIWYSRTSAQPDTPGATVVRVVAEQFTWTMHYPGADGRFGTTRLELITPDNPLGLDRTSEFGRDDLIVPGQLHLPVNRPVVIQLSSKDVIHSFGVGAMRIKQDAIPGLLSPIWFTPTETGTFDIACSQLCGLGHYRMRGQVMVDSDEAFREFLESEAAIQVR